MMIHGYFVLITLKQFKKNLALFIILELVGAYQQDEDQYQDLQPVFILHLMFQK